MVLPRCVSAHRIGLGETEYDHMGEQAPLSWSCVCGSWMLLESYDYDEEVWWFPGQERKDDFLAEHSNCIPLEVPDDELGDPEVKVDWNLVAQEIREEDVPEDEEPF